MRNGYGLISKTMLARFEGFDNQHTTMSPVTMKAVAKGSEMVENVETGKLPTIVGRIGKKMDVLQTFTPSGKLTFSYGKSPCYSWENSLFLWPFSIAILT